MRVLSGSVAFGVYPGFSATVQSRAGYNDGAWHYVVASLSSSGMQLFLDGKTVRMDATESHASPEAAKKAFERLKRALAGEGYREG